MSRLSSRVAVGSAIAIFTSMPAFAVASYSANATNNGGVITAGISASGIDGSPGGSAVTYDFFTPTTAGGSYLTLSAGALTGALITSTAMIGSSTDFDFNAVTLINAANNAVRYSFSIGTFGSVDMASIFTPLTTPLGIMAGDYFVRVGGTARGSGSYGGQVTLMPFATNAAVPEPAAWLMMVAGFGLLGATLRRRPRTLSLTYA